MKEWRSREEEEEEKFYLISLLHDIPVGKTSNVPVKIIFCFCFVRKALFAINIFRKAFGCCVAAAVCFIFILLYFILTHSAKNKPHSHPHITHPTTPVHGNKIWRKSFSNLARTNIAAHGRHDMGTKGEEYHIIKLRKIIGSAKMVGIVSILK